MPSDSARALDPEYPNLRPDVLDGYRGAPPGVAAEIIGGELYLLSRPAPRNQSAAAILSALLHPPCRWGRGGPGGWIVLPEPELSLGDLPDLAEPDLAGWHRDRLPTMPEDAAIRVVPDWVCEVLSSSTRRHDRFTKMPMYLSHGVGHAWLLDATAKTLEVFRRTADGWLLALSAAGDATVRAEPFEAIEIELRVLWEW